MEFLIMVNIKKKKKSLLELEIYCQNKFQKLSLSQLDFLQIE